jgi:hypothetical protein
MLAASLRSRRQLNTKLVARKIGQKLVNNPGKPGAFARGLGSIRIAAWICALHNGRA